ncbi:hypothetical protein BG452_05400 [Streptomyces sp. CBMA123]|nr:hypothetical protein [Streptomyces sp. CBMA123]
MIEPLLPMRDPRRAGRRLKFPRRLIVDTVLSVLVSGCAWRLVPHDLAPWDAACRWFRVWAANGIWDRVHDALRDRARVADGRGPQPSAAECFCRLLRRRPDAGRCDETRTGPRIQFPRTGYGSAPLQRLGASRKRWQTPQLLTPGEDG